MFGNQSAFRLGRLFGFPLYADFSLLLIAGVFILFDLQGGLGAVLRTLIFFACVLGSIVWHELGHAFTVRKLGHGESVISLSALGGLASFRGNPSPRDRIKISAAGPAYGLALGVLVLVLYALLPIDPASLLGSAMRVLIYAGIIFNLANLLPILPLDGGHILQSALLISRKRSPRRVLYTTTCVSLITLAVVMVGLFIWIGVGDLFLWFILIMLAMQNVQTFQALRREGVR